MSSNVADETTRADVTIENHGSICLLRPNHSQVAAWFKETAPEDAQFWGDSLVVEPRYVDGVIEALANEGFSCE
jgi:hypothetical protein